MWFNGLTLIWRLALIGGLLTLIGGALWKIHHNIAKGGYDRCRAEIAASQKEDRETHDAKEREIFQLPDSDLYERLSRWMRD